MSMALYIIEAKRTDQYNYHASTVNVSVVAEEYDQAIKIATKRLPKLENLGGGHYTFTLTDCIDERTADILPNARGIDIDKGEEDL